MKKEIFVKIDEMEKQAHTDYMDAENRYGENDIKTTRLKWRHLGMLELKRELLREFI